MEQKIKMKTTTSQLTIWGLKSDKLWSQFGHVDYGTWCVLECERINGRKGEFYVKHDGECVCIEKMP
jgi:hypothetical protein